MATNVLRALRERADQADVIIANLQQQVAFLRAAYAEKTAATLKAQNTALKCEVESLKTELCLTEITNGVRQYFVPANIAEVTSPSKVVTSPAKVATPAEVTAATPEVIKKPAVTKGKGDVNAAKGDASAAKGQKAEKKGKPAAAPENPNIDVSRLDMRVGRIIDVSLHPDADSLYVEKVDLGEEEPRTVVSGLVKHVPIEQMRDRLAVFMCNLKPAKMRGVLSQAMVMCASNEDKSTTEILDLPAGSVIGDRVSVAEYPGSPDAVLNPKKKIWEQVKPDLLTDKEGVATYKGAKWVIEGKGDIRAKTVYQGQIS